MKRLNLLYFKPLLYTAISGTIRVSNYERGALMNYRKIANKDSIILAIQNALSSSKEAKYYHRLDLVMLAVNGMPVKQIASLYNESPTTISYWTKKVIEQGVESLKEGKHTGRKPRLSPEDLKQLDIDMQKPPSDFGYDLNLWDGLLVSKHLSEHYNVDIKVRQCQRIIRQLGYTLQRPQTKPYGSTPEAQEEFKKN
jgi:transposase